MYMKQKITPLTPNLLNKSHKNHKLSEWKVSNTIKVGQYKYDILMEHSNN